MALIKQDQQAKERAIKSPISVSSSDENFAPCYIPIYQFRDKKSFVLFHFVRRTPCRLIDRIVEPKGFATPILRVKFIILALSNVFIL